MQHLKIHVWRPKKQNVGHSSILLPDGTYISWWPGGECSHNNPSIEAAPNSSFQEDADAEEDPYPPTFAIKVDDQQVANIKAWWEGFKSAEKYHIIDNNCSTVVFKALKQAFPSVDRFQDKIQVWVPIAVQLIAQDLAAEKEFSDATINEFVTAADGEAREIASNGGVKSKYLSIEKVRKVLHKTEEKAKKIVKQADDEDQNVSSSKKGRDEKQKSEACKEVRMKKGSSNEVTEIADAVDELKTANESNDETGDNL